MVGENFSVITMDSLLTAEQFQRLQLLHHPLCKPLEHNEHTSALEQQADIAKVQEWLGHVNISTTRVYDRRS